MFSVHESINNQKYPSIVKKYNEFNQVTFYYHKDLKFEQFQIYLGQKSSHKYLRLKVSTHGSNWTFFDEAALINSEKQTLKYQFESVNRKTSFFNSTVSEKFDDSLSESNARELLGFLKANNGNLKIRLSGEKQREHELNNSKINALIDVLNFYFDEL